MNKVQSLWKFICETDNDIKYMRMYYKAGCWLDLTVEILRDIPLMILRAMLLIIAAVITIIAAALAVGIGAVPFAVYQLYGMFMDWSIDTRIAFTLVLAFGTIIILCMGIQC